MSVDTPTVTIIAAAIGGSGIAALFSGWFGYLNTKAVHRAEQKKQIRDLAVQVALENWKQAMAGRKIDPNAQFAYVDATWMDIYLIHAAHLISALDGSLKTSEQIVTHLRNGFKNIELVQEELREYYKQRMMPK